MTHLALFAVIIWYYYNDDNMLFLQNIVYYIILYHICMQTRMIVIIYHQLAISCTHDQSIFINIHIFINIQYTKHTQLFLFCETWNDVKRRDNDVKKLCTSCRSRSRSGSIWGPDMDGISGSPQRWPGKSGKSLEKTRLHFSWGCHAKTMVKPMGFFKGLRKMGFFDGICLMGCF